MESTPSPGFPTTWTSQVASNTYVIDKAHWNSDPPPSSRPGNEEHISRRFGVDWEHFDGNDLCSPDPGAIPEMAGVALHVYYGIKKCIVPIAYFKDLNASVYAFTVVGPCDDDGKKEFYFISGTPATDTILKRYKQPFSSVQDFYENSHRVGVEQLTPVEGGFDAAWKVFEQYDMY
ncbi:hypothetical protein C8R46DRAFT_1104873 [Mycena filopes]|nr:hypothetical protein C8R46DRAFT_1104873 [Mycena filopes]